MKYVCTVEAVQWTGQELEGVSEDWDYYLGVQCGHKYTFSNGEYQKIIDKDWIVTEEDGRKIIMNDKEFTRRFKPYYGNLPVDKEIEGLYNRIRELDNEVAYARFGGKSF